MIVHRHEHRNIEGAKDQPFGMGKEIRAPKRRSSLPLAGACPCVGNWYRRSLLPRDLLLILILPLVIAPVIGALAWLLLTNLTAGALRFPLGWLGLGDFLWSADPDWALFSLIIIDVWIYTPFVTILVLAGLRSLPKSPYESALN